MSRFVYSKVIAVQQPVKSHNIISAYPGALIKFDFAADAAEFSRVDDDLLIRFGKDASVLIEGIFNLPQGNTPHFEIGEELVPGATFFDQLHIDTAVGTRNAQPAQSSGMGEYRDISSGLISGVDKLGDDSSPFAWENAQNQGQESPVAGNYEEPGMAIVHPPYQGDVLYSKDGSAVDEAYLPGGGKFDVNNASASESFLIKEIGLPYTDETLTEVCRVDISQGSGWVLNSESGKYEFRSEGASGYLVYNADDNTLYYVLDKSVAHGAPGSETDRLVSESIEGIKLVGKDGNSYSTTIVMEITDDAPTDVSFGSDATGNTEGHTAGAEYIGSWTADFGADGADGANALQITVRLGDQEFTYTVELGQAQDISFGGTNYGTLTLNGDGRFTFVSRPNTEGELNFTLIATDADGDTASSSDTGFTITVTTPEGPSDALTSYGSVDEALLPGGTAHQGGDSSGLVTEIGLTVTNSDEVAVEYTVDYNGWTNADNGIYTQKALNGYLTYDVVANKLTYTLDANADHAVAGAEEMDLNVGKVTLIGKGGNKYEVDVIIEISDDAPVAELSGEASVNAVEGALAINGEWEYSFGADGEGTAKVLVNGGEYDLDADITIKDGPTSLGILKVGSDGTWTFTPNANLDHSGGKVPSFDFQMQITDGDGDTATTGKQTVTISDGAASTIGEIAGLLLAEHALTEAQGGVSTESSFSITAGSDDITLGFDLDSIQIGGISAEIIWSRNADGSVTGRQNGVEVIRLEIANLPNGFLAAGQSSDAAAVRATLFGALNNALGSDLANISFTLVASDHDGTRVLTTVQLGIVDDKPGITLIGADIPLEVHENISTGIGGAWTYEEGADNEGAHVEVMVNGKLYDLGTDIEVCDGDNVAIGILNVNENGSWEFRPYPNMNQSASDSTFSFQLQVTDADGDVAISDSQSVTVLDSNSVNAADNLAIITGALHRAEGSTLSVAKIFSYKDGDYAGNTNNPGKVAGYTHLDSMGTGGDGAYEEFANYIGTVSPITILEGLGVEVSFKGPDTIWGGGAYQYAALQTKPVASSGGEITFDWMAKGGSAGDAAIWILQDANGRYVDSGLIHTYTGNYKMTTGASGTYTVSIPPTIDEHNYTLSIMVFDGGDVEPALSGSGAPNNSTVDYGQADFYVSEEMTYTKYVADPVSGNVISDPSPTGEVDIMTDTTLLIYITYQGAIKYFEGDAPLVFEIETGKLTIHKDGSYIFEPSGNGVHVDDIFTYTIASGLGQTSQADLHIKYSPSFPASGENDESGETPVVHLDEYVAEYNDVQESASRLSSFNISGTASLKLQALERAGWMTSEDNVSYYNVNPTLNQADRPPAPPGYASLVASHGYLAIVAALAYTGSYAGGGGSYSPYERSWVSAFFNISTDTPKGNTATPAVGTADRIITETLWELGIQGSWDDMRSSGNDFVLNAVGKNFESSGGKIAFGYSFNNNFTGCHKAAGFWFLKDAHGDLVRDANGNLIGGSVQSGTTGKVSGIAELDIPYTVEAHTYTIVMGSMEIGAGNNTQKSTLTITPPIVIEDDADYTGNVLNNSNLPEGLAVWLGSVTFDGGETFYFSDTQKQATFKTDKGTLVINRDGEFKFFANDDVGPDDLLKEGNFTVVGIDDQEGSFAVGNIDLRPAVFSALVGITESMEGDLAGNQAIDDDGSVISAGADDDALFAGSDAVTIFGRAGDDVLIAGSDAVIIFGEAGNDVIYGAEGNDTLSGGAGNDLIYGGSGDNYLFGGTGADTFAWTSTADFNGRDLIMDFSTAEGDRFNFSSLLDGGETFEDILGVVGMDTHSNTMNFTLKDGALEKQVEVRFTGDQTSSFNDFITSFNSAQGDEVIQTELILQFLKTLNG